jgi:cytochrome c oxidase subunit 2
MELLTQASSFAASIDGLILLITVMVAFWFILANIVFFTLIWRFRARPGVKSRYITGNEPHLKRWITIPHALVLVCDVFIIVGAMRVWYNIKQRLPEADATIRVTGQQWAWVFQYPGADGALDTPDDVYTTDDLYVQVDRTYHFQLQSRDVIHDFSVPVFRLKQDAIPGRTITGWFQPTRTGTFDIQCAEICGIGHGVMGGRIHVQDAATHAAWTAARAAAGTQTASAQ